MASCRTTDSQQQHHQFPHLSDGEPVVDSPHLPVPSSCSILSMHLPSPTYFPQQSLEALHRFSPQITSINQNKPSATPLLPCPQDSSPKLPYGFRPGQPRGESRFAGLHILPLAARSKHLRLLSSQQVAMKRGSWMLEAGDSEEIVDLSSLTSQEISNANALAASKSHSEAEKRRRERINQHLTTLRGLLPSSTKTDKASLLAEVIEYVKTLKRQAADITEGPLPSDTDQLSVAVDFSSTDKRSVIKASISCADRPDLLSDFTQTLRTLGLKPVRAEIVTLAGRMKNVFLITCEEDDKDTTEGSPSQNRVQEALKAVLEKSISTSFFSQKLN